MKLWFVSQDVHSKHEYEFGVVDILFHIAIKPDAELEKQRITKVPIPYRDQKKQILDDLEHKSIIERVDEVGSEFINPILIRPKSVT